MIQHSSSVINGSYSGFRSSGIYNTSSGGLCLIRFFERFVKNGTLNRKWAVEHRTPLPSDGARFHTVDVEQDGKTEFAVGCNGSGGVRLYNHKGNRTWKQPDGNVWHVEAANINQDERPEIVHSNAGGEITVREGNGNIVQRHDTEGYFSSFHLVESRDHSKYLMTPEDGSIHLLRFNGSIVKELEAPYSDTLGDVKGTYVSLSDSKSQEYLAALLHYKQQSKSLLYLYDPTGKRVYTEVIDGSCQSLVPFYRSFNNEEKSHF